MGTTTRRRLHRAGERRSRGERLGTGAVSHGRPARYGSPLRYHRTRDQGDSRVSKGSAQGNSPHPRHRHHAGARHGRRDRGRERRRHSSSRRARPETPLRLSDAAGGERAARHGEIGSADHRPRRSRRGAGVARGSAGRDGHVNLIDVLPVALLGGVLGLDVVGFPQAMISRPLVAATAGGALLGHSMSGLMIGAALELIALETLPFGAARYPEWGSAATVGGAVYANHFGDPPGAMAIAVMAAVATGWIGGGAVSQRPAAHP